MADEKPEITKAFALLILAGYRLTMRETEIFILLSRGKRNKEIASMLFIDYKTARTHRARICKKLNAHSKHALTEIARRLGLV
ncbi:MAG: response regulator transcription factor [Bacteroidetes bacterium]|nr:response regulator transcription factor [Bacteroidota bacterium]